MFCAVTVLQCYIETQWWAGRRKQELEQKTIQGISPATQYDSQLRCLHPLHTRAPQSAPAHTGPCIAPCSRRVVCKPLGVLWPIPVGVGVICESIFGGGYPCTNKHLSDAPYIRIRSNRGNPQSTIMQCTQNIHTHSNCRLGGCGVVVCCPAGASRALAPECFV